MSLDDALGRLQDAAWEHVTSLTDSGALSNEQLAGWTQVARAAQPLLNALERPDLLQSIQRAATAIPAIPAARATPDPHLVSVATAMQEVLEQLPPEEAARQNARDVVALVIQSTARTAAVESRASHNPQVRTLGTELDATALDAHATVADTQAQAVPTPSPAAAMAPSETPPAARSTAARRDDPSPSAPTQTRGRRL